MKYTTPRTPRLLPAVWLGLLLLGPLSGTLADVHAEDLLEVYAEARAADPLLAGAYTQSGIQREAAVQALAPLLPQWQLNAYDTRDRHDSGHGHQTVSSLSQVVFDLGRLRTLDAERTQESAQDARVRAAEQDLCARVASAYFGVLAAQAALATTQASEDALGAQASQAQKRFEAGLVAQVDVEQGRAYHALSRGSTVQARQALADARQALAQIIGRTPGALRPLAPEIQALPPDPPEPQVWVDQALRANPAVLSLALSVEASQQRIAAARAAHWPTLSAGVDTSREGGAALGNLSDVDRNRSTTTQVGFRLTVPLFAGGATQSQVRQAALRRDAAREELVASQRRLVRDTQAQYQAVLAGIALLESSRDAMAAADRALASTRTGQTLGTRSQTDLLLALQTQTAAQSAYDRARHGYVLARLLLQQAAGALGEAELTTINRLLR